jgi:lycopene cyclase domain-containing protein
VSYTAAAGAGVLAAVVLDLVVLRTALVARRGFWVSYAIVLFFQLVVNGVLTGVRIVRYDPSAIVGWRIAYAPIEDLLFGFALVLTTLAVWTRAGRRAERTEPASGRSAPPPRDAPDRRVRES